MTANPELLEMKARIDRHVADLEHRLPDVIAERGLSGELVAQLMHTRDQARKHQARIAMLARKPAGKPERLVVKE